MRILIFGQKIYLILYPSLGNLTYHIIIVWELSVKSIDQLLATHFISISIPRQYCQVKYVHGEKIRKEITSLWCRLINSTSSTTTVTQWSKNTFEVTYTIFGWNNFWRSILDSSSIKGVPIFFLNLWHLFWNFKYQVLIYYWQLHFPG